MARTYSEITAVFDEWKNESLKQFKDASAAEDKQKAIAERKLLQFSLEAHLAADSVIPNPVPGLIGKFEDIAASLDVISYKNGLRPQFLKSYTELIKKTSEALNKLRLSETLYGTSDGINVKINKIADRRKEYGAVLKSFFEMRNGFAEKIIKSDRNMNLLGEFIIGHSEDITTLVAKNLEEIISPHFQTVNGGKVPDRTLKNMADNYQTQTGKGFFSDYTEFLRIKNLGYPIAFEEYNNLANMHDRLSAAADEIEKNKEQILSTSQIKSRVIDVFKNAALNPGFIYDFKKDFPEHSGNPTAYDIHAYESLKKKEIEEVKKRKDAYNKFDTLVKIAAFLHSAEGNPVVKDAVISTMSGVLMYSHSNPIPKTVKENCIKAMQSVIQTLRKPYADKIYKRNSARDNIKP